VPCSCVARRKQPLISVVLGRRVGVALDNGAVLEDGSLQAHACISGR
jgi:hypothetical protein